LALILAFSAACTNPDLKDYDNDNYSDLEADWSTLDEKQESDMEEIVEELDTDYCLTVEIDNLTPEEVANLSGATSFYYGTFIKDGSEWIGREKWLLFATPKWVDNGGYDCEVTWDLRATESTSTNCMSCDFSLQVSASVNQSQTDCPDGLWNYEALLNWSTTYEVERSDSEATFYFLDGRVIGSGESRQNSMNFISEPDCKWF